MFRPRAAAGVRGGAIFGRPARPGQARAVARVRRALQDLAYGARQLRWPRAGSECKLEERARQRQTPACAPLLAQGGLSPTRSRLLRSGPASPGDYAASTAGGDRQACGRSDIRWRVVELLP